MSLRTECPGWFETVPTEVSGASQKPSCRPNDCAKKSTDYERWQPDFKQGEPSCWWIYPEAADQSDEGSEKT